MGVFGLLKRVFHGVIWFVGVFFGLVLGCLPGTVGLEFVFWVYNLHLGWVWVVG